MNLTSMWEWLSGKKTYICCALLLVAVFLKTFNLIDGKSFELIVTALVGLGGISMRAALNNVP